MRVRVVPFSEVAAEVSKPSRSQRFNTASHQLDEIAHIVPEHDNFKHEIPTWKPFDYTIWMPLIAQSQQIPAEDHFVGRLPDFTWGDLMGLCHSASLMSTDSKVWQSRLDETIETLESTKAGRELAAMFDGRRPWFVRLAQMSPKDSPLGGELPSWTLKEAIAKICSSMRVYGCLEREKEHAEEHKRDIEIKIAVNRWDPAMDTAREFRVFVPPPRAHLSCNTVGNTKLRREMKISAISQYKWHSAFVSPYPNLDLEQTAERVRCGAQTILDQILLFMEDTLERDITIMLIRYGFTFDIIVKEKGEVQLIEINPFGARSVCGAGLLNWATDAKILYGFEEAVFAVTTEEYAVV
jgi:hypothetical protein